MLQRVFGAIGPRNMGTPRTTTSADPPLDQNQGSAGEAAFQEPPSSAYSAAVIIKVKSRGS